MPVYVWFPVLAGLSIGFCFMNIPPVAEQFMALFGVGYAGLSLFLSGLLWSHSLSQVPVGIIVDRMGPFRCVLAAMGAGTILNLLPLLAPGSILLGTGLRFLLGLCTGLAFLAIIKILGLLAPPGEMAKAQGFYGGAFGFGTMLPYLLLPYMGPSEYGWLASYLTTAALCFMTFVATLHLYRKHERQGRGRPQTTAAEGTAVRIGVLLRRTFLSPEIWMLGLFHGVFYGTLTNLGQWLPSILADLADGNTRVWSLATMLVLFVGSCSRLFSGYVLRVLSRRRAIRCSLVLVFVFYVILANMPHAGSGLVVGLLLALSCGLSYGAVFTMGARVLPAVFTGTAVGLLNTIANLANVGLTLLFGNIREHTGGFTLALYCTGAASLALLFVFARRLGRLDERLG